MENAGCGVRSLENSESDVAFKENEESDVTFMENAGSDAILMENALVLCNFIVILIVCLTAVKAVCCDFR